MIQLSNERIEQILHKETVKTEELGTILRSIYARYMRLYEKYFADIDALNDDEIARLNKYHEETASLVKYYYMDIPMDVCTGIREFESKFSANLLGPKWHDYLFGSYEEFKERSCGNESEASLKAEFTKQALESFYEAMEYVFRDGFGTGSNTAKSAVDGITELLFGKDK